MTQEALDRAETAEAEVERLREALEQLRDDLRSGAKGRRQEGRHDAANVLEALANRVTTALTPQQDTDDG
jgi:signal transduction protein with GAF and PtsI domain